MTCSGSRVVIIVECENRFIEKIPCNTRFSKLSSRDGSCRRTSSLANRRRIETPLAFCYVVQDEQVTAAVNATEFTLLVGLGGSVNRLRALCSVCPISVERS